MKPKHISLMVIFLIVIILGLAAGYEINHHMGADALSGLAPPKPLSEIKVPDRSVLAQMDRLERKMHLLSSPPAQYKRVVDLSGLGYVPLSRMQSNGADGSPDRFPGPSYRVSMAFHGQVKRHCVVDGHLYAEGAVLPDGTAIEKIESRRVLIANENLQQWLLVEPVFDTALSDKILQGDNG